MELPVTVHTRERFLARVYPQVSVEVSVRPEGLAALVALVRFFAGVNPLVLLQTAGVEKPLPAHIANERLLPRVASLVVAERVFVVERLPTYATVVLLVLTVASFVELERTRGAETPQTYLATERFNQRLVLSSSLEKSLRAVCLLVPVGVHVPLMYQQPAVEEEGLPAQIAHKRLSGAVDEHVGLQLVVVREALATLLTGERLFSGVDAKVPFEVVVQAEPRSTYVTGERFLPCMDYAVSFQSSAGPVRPVAHAAYERSDACVFPLMHRQGVGVFESFVAHRAFVFFGV